MRDRRVLIYDTTLRDGAQGKDITFSVEGKIRIAKKLNHLGFDYIEGGWVPSNPKDSRFFNLIQQEQLENSKIVACGSTRRPNVKPKDDKGLQALVDSQASTIAIVGKTWQFHVDEVLKTSTEENLSMIEESIRFLKQAGREVIYDAEHFFDGYHDNPQYAVKTLLAAQEAGADFLCLCDTNGGNLPQTISSVVEQVNQKLETDLGVHAHDDSGLAVANSIAAVQQGAKMVQGTINGYGERVGNTNLTTLIPNIVLKLGVSCLKNEETLRQLSSLSHYVSEMANKRPNKKAPFVGTDAFTHKAGLHVDAVIKHPHTFEHIPPETVGNERNFLISELAGMSTLKRKLKNMGVDISGKNDLLEEVLSGLKSLEEEGYQFENANASFELLVKRVQNNLPRYFHVQNYNVTVEKDKEGHPIARGYVKIKVKGETREGKSKGEGPVNALDKAVRGALNRFFPAIEKMKLTDYKVRILESQKGTAAKPRVFIEMTDGNKTWSTIGVSSNIIEASWQALKDGYIYGLEENQTKEQSAPKDEISQEISTTSGRHTG